MDFMIFSSSMKMKKSTNLWHYFSYYMSSYHLLNKITKSIWKEELMVNCTIIILCHQSLTLFSMYWFHVTPLIFISPALWQWSYITAMIVPCLCLLHAADCAGMAPHEHEQHKGTLVFQTQNKSCFYVTSLPKC